VIGKPRDLGPLPEKLAVPISRLERALNASAQAEDAAILVRLSQRSDASRQEQ
jgi:hypothetical protein